MNDQFDTALHEYYKNHKIEIANNGFSEKLIQKLPNIPTYTWILYIAYFLGLVVIVIMGSFKQVLNQLSDFLTRISTFHLPSITSLVVLFSIAFLVILFAKISFDENFA